VAKRLRDLTELNHVNATFPALDLRHEALMAAQSCGELNLRDAGSLPNCDKELDKFLMPLREY
jgi:hypothetical protein